MSFIWPVRAVGTSCPAVSITSASRRSIAVPRAVANRRPTAATMPVATTNTITGMSTAISHLDLHDLPDPDVTHDLQDDGRENHHVPQPLLEEQVDVIGVDERQRDRERCRQRHQHVTRHAAV